MRILVIGASGFLGAHCHRLLTRRGTDVFGTVGRSAPTETLRRVDLTSSASVRRLLDEVNPEAVIWCAKHTGEARDEQTINEVALPVLGHHAHALSRFLFVSTDGVLPGVRGPYDESTTPMVIAAESSIAQYTNTKLWAEQFIVSHFPDACVVRVGPIYGRSVRGLWDARTLQIREQLAMGQEVRRAKNILRTFVAVEDLAHALLELLHVNVRGVLHIGPQQWESHLSFACHVARAFGLSGQRIYPFTLADEEVASRQVRLDTTMDTALARRLLRTPFRSVAEAFQVL